MASMDSILSATLAEVLTEILPWLRQALTNLDQASRHGPTTYVRVEFRIRNSTELWAEVYMRARETKKDWTTAEGTTSFKVYDSPGRIIEVLSSSVQDHRYTDTNHEMDVFSFPPSNMMSRVEYVGDTKGDEAGKRTGCQIFFHPVRLLVEG